MIRLLTAAAMAALLAAPAMAQSVSPGQPGSSTRDPAIDSLSRSPGQIPADCTPTDARPECQTAQMPGQNDSPSADSPASNLPEPSTPGVMMPPAERSETPSSPSGSGSSGSGGMGR